MWAAQRPIVDCPSKRFRIDFEAASRGGIFQTVSAIGRSFVNGGRGTGFLTYFHAVGERSRQRNNEYMMTEAAIVRACRHSSTPEFNSLPPETHALKRT